MKKWLRFGALLCLCAALLAGCGGTEDPEDTTTQDPAEEEVQTPAENTPDSGGPLAPEAVEALSGGTLPGGFTLETQDCAVIVSYIYECQDSSQEAMDALEAEITAYADGIGYSLMTAAGETGLVYALNPYGESSYLAVALGAEDSLHPGEESGGSRRFAQHYDLWAPLTGSDWQVLSVEEQDYYVEDGAEYPCYLLTLTAAE